MVLQALRPQCKEPTYKIELLTQSIMATSQLPSAVDPAVRMALTHDWVVRRNICMDTLYKTHITCRETVYRIGRHLSIPFPFQALSSLYFSIPIFPRSIVLPVTNMQYFNTFCTNFISFFSPSFSLFQEETPFFKKILQNRFPGLFLPPVSLYNLLNTLRFC